MDKKHLRQQLRARRRALSAVEVSTASEAVVAELKALPCFLAATHVAYYCASEGEVDVLPLAPIAAAMGKKSYLPVLARDPQRLQFHAYEVGAPLRQNAHGILEPSNADVPLMCEPEHLSLVLVPLVAFDEEGHRLGRGAGYYDRAFAFLRTRFASNALVPRLVGVGYEFQRVQTLPHDVWDVPLSIVVTELRTYMIDPVEL